MYDNLQNAEIHVHAELEGQVCGMCGTCSDNQSDELQMPNGDIVRFYSFYQRIFFFKQSSAARIVLLS